MKTNRTIFSLALLFLTLTISCNDSGVANNTLKKGLVGEYLFNGNTNDSNPRSVRNDGTNHGATLTTDRNGTENAAYYFDGVDDYISIADNDELDFDFDENFSISLWASVNFPQASPADGMYDMIRKWSGNTNDGYSYGIAYLNENAAFGFNTFYQFRYDGAMCANGPQQTSTEIDSDAWHHVAMVKAGTKLYQYLDGVLVSEVDDDTACTTTNDIQITIGCRGQLVRFFNGKLDDIKFYNRALTLKEVQKLSEE